MDLSRAVWQKSTLCGTSSCVEIALVDDTVALRDSKNLDGTVLLFGREEWIQFLDGARRGEFEPSALKQP